MKILGVSGTITGSKTKIVVERALDYVKKIDQNIEVELLDLKTYNLQFCDGRDPKSYTGDTKKVIDMVAGADFYIIGTPVFHGTMPGTLKNLFDLIPVETLKDKVIGFIAVGGNLKHYLMIENQLKPIAGYLRAFVAPNYVFVHNDDFRNSKIINEDILTQIFNLSKEVIMLQKGIKTNFVKENIY
ncbi:NADH-dependent FMN reductase [Pueribacillus theae]|uniref:NADH-dependent FMN reductase n=1 Tax=Pueribacillus theae TaxID=2171751 RepID=A0A2U1K5D0_9BACI|nr:NAD(P)H-dependent oxidoreductase [Pueribacillus theae]PWA12168.1 NADH-dependent FMN reductase [Pueribacillus theae]